MENKIITKSLKRQLNQVIVHEQVENGVAINNNLSENQIDQQFVTPRIISHLK
jgi:phage-related tail protein